jgi:hypothetical protein
MARFLIFIYAIGPVRKGSLWETIAVPELRVQVSELSRLLLTVRKSEQPRPEQNFQTPRTGPMAALPRQREGGGMYFEQFYLAVWPTLLICWLQKEKRSWSILSGMWTCT